jgi:hypothetical protein
VVRILWQRIVVCELLKHEYLRHRFSMMIVLGAADILGRVIHPKSPFNAGVETYLHVVFSA